MTTRRGPSHEAIVGGWLNDLASLTAGSRPLDEQKAKVAALTGVLADTFPDDATFSKDSLYAISRQVAFLPSFAELHRMLSDWWETHRPRVFVEPFELAQAALPAHERANVLVWLRHEAIGDLAPNELMLRLAVIRRYAPRGYRWLIATFDNATANDIARAQGWLSRADWQMPNWETPERQAAE